MGLRFPGELIARVLKRVGIMEDNTFVQLMIQEGRLREARRIVLDLGRIRLGPPGEETVAVIEALTDLDRLEELSLRVLDATIWAELLARGKSHQDGA
jgi:hypothetical protein